MSITKPTINKLLSLLLVLSVVLAGLLPSTAVYASEVNTPGSAKSNAVLNSDGLIMDVTVPTNVLIYVDEHGEVTTPDYLPIINNSVAPVFVHSLSVTPKNGWTLDPTNTDYTNFKVNRKNYWLSFNGLDPSNEPIALATPINGSDSLNLVLSAGVAPQKTAINGLNIGEILITFDWDAAEGAQEPVIPPDTGSFTVGEVYHEYVDGYGDYVFIPLLTGGVGNYRIIIAAEGTDPETQALVNEVINKKSDESTTVGVPLPGYNPAQTYEVYVTYVDDEESDTIMKVLSAKDTGGTGDQDINFEVHSVDHGGEGVVEFYMTVETPSFVEFAMVPAGSQPPYSGTHSFILEYAGTHTRGIYVGYDDSIDYDIYIWVYDLNDAELNPVGPVKVLLAAYDSGSGDDDSGSGDNQEFGFSVEGATHVGYKTFAITLTVTESDNYLFAAVPPNAPIPSPLTPPPAHSLEYIYDAGVHELEIVFTYATNDMTEADIYIWRLNDYDHIGPVKVEVRETEGEDSENTGPNGEFIPEGYVLATDEDFSGTRDGEFRYIGSKPYVVVPHVIKGVPVTSYHYMFAGTDVKGVASDNPNITDMSYMFAYSTSETLDLTYLDTSNVVNMSGMFNFTSAKNLDLSNFDTSKVTDMSSMFYGYFDTTLDLSGFDTSNVTDMSWMFAYSYYSPDFTNLDTSNVTNMAGMFEGNYSTTLNLTGLDTSSVTDMSNMFKGGRATSYDFSNFDTRNVTNMTDMFEDNDATTLDLSNFDISSLTKMSSMFRYSSATTIDISSFRLAEIQPSIIGIFDYADNLTTVYVRAQEDIDYIIERSYSEIPDTINFVIK